MNQIWAWVVAILSAVFMGLKIRGDHYKDESEQKDEDIAGIEAEGSLGEFNAAQAERHKQALKNLNKKGNDNEIDNDAITTSID